MTQYEVAVIGAGPSGAVAATLLAREGVRVAMLDGKSRPQIIGETLPGAAARLLKKLDLPGPLSSSMHKPVSGTISNWDGRVTVEDSFTSPDGQSWRLDRQAFDSALLMAHKLSLEADTLVDATGRCATVSRQLGATRIVDEQLLTVWGEGQIATEEMSPTNRTLIDSDTDGWWYGAWLPNRKPLAAFQCSPKKANKLRRCTDAWIECMRRSEVLSKHLNPDAFVGSKLSCAVASSSRIVPVAGKNWIACGDAAIAFDPLASQGLLNALASGAKVAATILAKNQADAYASYQGQIDEIWNIYLKRRVSTYQNSSSFYSINSTVDWSAVGTN